ncbi:MAG: hypothetical protein IPM56_04475 [Ignavibacteriales bacterium]|nr:MAG: hypothetical protein IPM56_04475 [Ignavibacteriales bacterium]
MKKSLIICSFFILAFFIGCEEVQTPVEPNVTQTLQKGGVKIILVCNVEQLYDAVNNPANMGKYLFLTPGTYVLSVNDSSGNPRLNSGRLELQKDMSLYGVLFNRSAVVIDASGLPNASFLTSFGRTGPIRIGRGKNSIEWLTILGNDFAAGGIETDLIGTPTTEIKVAHVVSGGSLRGIDVRNIGATMIGRRIDAKIFDNECFGKVEGIRLVNTNGANQGQIYAELRNNYAHDFYFGIIANNNRCTSGIVEVTSRGDKFEGNGLGGLIIGGSALAGTSVSNSTTFEAHGSKFINNNGPINPDITDAGGLLVIGADAFGPDVTFSNTVTVRLWNTKVYGNQNIDFQGFGSRSISVPPVLGGTDNHALIKLYGTSRWIDLAATNSLPEDPNNTNTVTIIR